MNREEALRKAVEIAPEFSEPEVVLAYADWLLAGVVETRVAFVPESYDPLADAEVGAIGLDSGVNVWLKESNGRWSAYSGEDGNQTRYTDDSIARYCGVSIVGKVRPSGVSGTVFRDLLGQSVSEKNISDYPVGLLALDDGSDVWEYLGSDEWKYYSGHDGHLANNIHTTYTVEAWRATIVGGIRGQA